MKSVLTKAADHCNYLVVSYNENGHISKDGMLEIFSELGEVSHCDVNYVRYRGGRNRSKSENTVIEHIFIVNTKGKAYGKDIKPRNRNCSITQPNGSPSKKGNSYSKAKN